MPIKGILCVKLDHENSDNSNVSDVPAASVGMTWASVSDVSSHRLPPSRAQVLVPSEKPFIFTELRVRTASQKERKNLGTVLSAVRARPASMVRSSRSSNVHRLNLIKETHIPLQPTLGWFGPGPLWLCSSSRAFPAMSWKHTN
jgi:hypothetical protein